MKICNEKLPNVFLTIEKTSLYDLIRRTIGVALGDFYISCTKELFAKNLYENDRTVSKVYQYYFTAKSNMIKDSCAKWQDTCHGTDLMPTFGIPLRYSQKFSDEEKKLSIKMILHAVKIFRNIIFY